MAQLSGIDCILKRLYIKEVFRYIWFHIIMSNLLSGLNSQCLLNSRAVLDRGGEWQCFDPTGRHFQGAGNDVDFIIDKCLDCRFPRRVEIPVSHRHADNIIRVGFRSLESLSTWKILELSCRHVYLINVKQILIFRIEK